MPARSIKKAVISIGLLLAVLGVVTGAPAIGRGNDVSGAADDLDRTALAFLPADGSPPNLADFSGKTILLNVWATWCPPCREEVPSLDRLQATKGSETFEVIALSIDNKGIAMARIDAIVASRGASMP